VRTYFSRQKNETDGRFLGTVKKVAETIKVSAEAVAAARSPEFSPTGLHRVVSRKIGERGGTPL
jgi:hypothetical protein